MQVHLADSSNRIIVPPSIHPYLSVAAITLTDDNLSSVTSHPSCSPSTALIPYLHPQPHPLSHSPESSTTRRSVATASMSPSGEMATVATSSQSGPAPGPAEAQGDGSGVWEVSMGSSSPQPQDAGSLSCQPVRHAGGALEGRNRETFLKHQTF